MKKSKKIFIFLQNFSAAFNSRYISDFAASTAFFLFLSLIPLLALLFAILPYTPISEEMLLGFAARVAPDSIDELVIGFINEIYESSAGVITTSVVITLWSAGKAMQALIRGLNYINDIEENRNYLVLRALACFYTVALLIAMVVMMGILMFGRVIVNFVLRHVPQLENFRGTIILARYPIAVVILIILFVAIYCVVPSRKQKFGAQLPGAVFSGIAWSIASWIFSIYINNFDGFSTYGSLATVIIVMFYMYMMMYIILVGAYLNKWLGRSHGGNDERTD